MDAENNFTPWPFVLCITLPALVIVLELAASGGLVRMPFLSILAQLRLGATALVVGAGLFFELTGWLAAVIYWWLTDSANAAGANFPCSKSPAFPC